MANPIWKDYFVSLGNLASASYQILVGGTAIYNGKAYRKPGMTDNIIRINDICADYFKNTLPSLSQSEFSRLSFPITFDVKVWMQNEWVTVDSVAFDNNWSYDYGYDPATMGLSFPINGKIDRRQPIFLSVYNASDVTVDVYFTDGTSLQVIIPIARTDDFDDSFNDDFSNESRGTASGVVTINPTEWETLSNKVDRVVVNGRTYQAEDSCARYVLYYVNAFGGWDSFLIEGNSLENDAITRHLRSVVYDNRDISNRGDENYVNEITKGFRFTTGWLTDIESQRMHHLINSTCVYMYDLTYGEMIPVVLKDSSLEYKTYKTQGNRLVNYTILADVAQNRVRR